MPRTRQIINAFNAGELSPLMDGRTDLAKYHNGAKTVENLICIKQGGVKRRPGTHFVAEVKDSTKETRLIPFIFSTGQGYILEFGETYIRFYKNGARIESPPGTPVEIATPYLEAELFDIQFSQSADILYLAHGNHFPQKLSRISDTSWSLMDLGTPNSAFLRGPFLNERPNTVDAPDITFTPSGISGSITLVASAPFFQAGHLGALLRLKIAGTWGYVVLTGITDSTDANATVVGPVALGGTAASDSFAEGAWSDVQGFPSTVTLFQQRLWWASTANNPDTIWGSQSNLYENYDPGTALDDEACTFVLASNKVYKIEWIAPSRTILSGSSGQEWDISGTGGTDSPITPSSVFAKAQSTHGSNTVAPVQVDNTVLFLQRAGRKLRELSYQFTTDSYVAPDLTILSEHITFGGITQMDYQEELDSIIWLVRADGTLVGMTYERAQDVVAWHRHITGTNQDTTDGQFESVAVIPHPSATEDQAWIIVKRHLAITKTILDIVGDPPHAGKATYHIIAHGFSTGDVITFSNTSDPSFDGMFVVDASSTTDYVVVYTLSSLIATSGSGGFASKLGSIKRYVEYLDTQGGYYGYLEVDAGLTYSGTPTSTLSGLNHLNGYVVDILGDGIVYPQQVVISGQVTGLIPMVTQAEVGLHFNSTLLTLRPESGASDGTAQGARKRFNEIIARLDSTSGVTINGYQTDFSLFTGDQRVTNLGWDKDARISIMQKQPLPFTLLALIGVLNVND
jgi:hypothetical protein